MCSRLNTKVQILCNEVIGSLLLSFSFKNKKKKGSSAEILCNGPLCTAYLTFALKKVSKLQKVIIVTSISKLTAQSRAHGRPVFSIFTFWSGSHSWLPALHNWPGGTYNYERFVCNVLLLYSMLSQLHQLHQNLTTEQPDSELNNPPPRSLPYSSQHFTISVTGFPFLI